MFAIIAQTAITLALSAANAGPHNAQAVPLAPAPPAPNALGDHRIYGTIQSMQGETLVLRTRSGKELVVDRRAAKSFVAFARGRAVIVYGNFTANGALEARAIWRTFPDAAHWPADR